jgi:hypothetical protein
MSVSKEELDASTEETLTLDRLLDPVSRCLTPDVARRIIELRADPELQKRVDLLADRSAEGQLTPEERLEYETYVRASRFIAILQAKARKLLARHPSS